MTWQWFFPEQKLVLLDFEYFVPVLSVKQIFPIIILPEDQYSICTYLFCLFSYYDILAESSQDLESL